MKIVIEKGHHPPIDDPIKLTKKQKKKRKQNQSPKLKKLRGELDKLADALPETTLEFAEEVLTSEVWSRAHKAGGHKKGMATMRAIAATTNHYPHKTLVVAYISTLLQIISTN